MSSSQMTSRERILAALRSQPVDRPPVWMMRQAGRHLPEYRAVREGRTFMDVVRTPALAAEVTIQPVRRYGLDAAILFSDILTIPEALGIEVTFPKGVGPRLHPTVTTAAEIAALPPGDVRGTLAYVAGAVRETRRQLGEETALLGFSGAPWTLACYMIEGGGSKSFSTIRAMMYRDPETWVRCSTSSPISSSTTCACRLRRASTRCSSSTPGPASCGARTLTAW